MTKVFTIIGYIAIGVLIVWLILRALNSDNNAEIKSTYLKQAELRIDSLQNQVFQDSIFIDSILNNKKNVDSLLSKITIEKELLKSKLYEKRNQIINDPDSVIPFVKGYLSSFKARQY